MASESKKDKSQSAGESFERLELLEKQNYANLKSLCQKNGTLFEDEIFPANNSSFYCKDAKIEFKWLRPSQIKTNPKFCNDLKFPAKINAVHGEIGNVWFPGVVMALVMNKQNFDQVIPTADQSFEAPEYAGIFYFCFWYQGQWRKVVIDDRLPTIAGQLVMAHEKTGNYFFVSLLEKAYAKLVGCYEALGGTTSSEVLEDFSGGCCETYLLKGRENPQMFPVIYKSILHSSLLCCYIEIEDKQPYGKQLENGLCQGHFYVLSAVNSIDLEDETNQIQLIRLRNSTTNVAEWKGAWGPKSREWELIPELDKERFGLSLELEGEFWMTYDDFKSNFSKLDICNMNKSTTKYKWEILCHDGIWEPGTSSGGCSTKGPFYTNPRYGLTVSAKDCDPDDGGLATVVVSLLQKDRSAKKNTGLFDLKIGFQIYQVENESGNLTNDFFYKNKPVAGTKCYINYRQVVCRCRLKPGNYLVVPSTFKANQKGAFLLRMFMEKIDWSTEADISYSLKPISDFSNKNGLFKLPLGQIQAPGSVTASILYRILKSYITFEQIYFSIDKCQLLVSMYDERKEGFITGDQLRQLCADLNEYYGIFCSYLRNEDGCLRLEDIRQCFDHMGVFAGASLIRIILNRYGTATSENQSELGKQKADNEESRSIEFSNFAICALKLRATILMWEIKTHKEQMNNNVRGSKRIMAFTLREFVEQMMLL